MIILPKMNWIMTSEFEILSHLMMQICKLMTFSNWMILLCLDQRKFIEFWFFQMATYPCFGKQIAISLKSICGILTFQISVFSLSQQTKPRNIIDARYNISLILSKILTVSNNNHPIEVIKIFPFCVYWTSRNITFSGKKMQTYTEIGKSDRCDSKKLKDRCSNWRNKINYYMIWKFFLVKQRNSCS